MCETSHSDRRKSDKVDAQSDPNGTPSPEGSRRHEDVCDRIGTIGMRAVTSTREGKEKKNGRRCKDLDQPKPTPVDTPDNDYDDKEDLQRSKAICSVRGITRRTGNVRRQLAYNPDLAFACPGRALGGRFLSTKYPEIAGMHDPDDSRGSNGQRDHRSRDAARRVGRGCCLAVAVRC